MAALSSVFSRPRRLGVRILTGKLSSDFRSVQDAMSCPGVWGLALSSGGGGGGGAYSSGTWQFRGEGGWSGSVTSFGFTGTHRPIEVAFARYMEIIGDGKGGLAGLGGESIGVRYGQRSEVTHVSSGGSPGRQASIATGGFNSDPQGSEKTVYWSRTSGDYSRRWQTITSRYETGLEKQVSAGYMSGGGRGGFPNIEGGNPPEAGKDGGILYLLLLG